MQRHLRIWLEALGLHLTNFTALLTALALILVISIIIHFILHRVVLGTLQKRISQKQVFWHKTLVEYKLFNRMALVLQGFIIYIQANLWLINNSLPQEIVQTIAELAITLYILLSAFSMLDTLLDLSKHSPTGKLPLRGIFQGVKLAASTVCGIFILSILIDKSPLILFSGLGAMTAVLMLVFKDPILGLVAGIQLATDNMLQIGDWLEMSRYGADGEVTDIGLTTVKVRNWDNTVTTIPTYSLISDSFKNWRAMSESGGRRIKRSLNIDTTSIHFLSDEEFKRLSTIRLLAPYLQKVSEEVAQFNQEHGLSDESIDARRLTNIGTFRAYLQAYLQANARIRKDMTLMVRQLAPTPEGLPLEIYAFTNTTAWGEYESIQADIFDHVFAAIDEFGLRIHQIPSGNDMRTFVTQAAGNMPVNN